MATLKLRHLVLFALSFLLLILSEMPGGALLTLFAWMQLSILLWKKEFTLKNQIKFFILFLSLLPTYFLWGAVNSFIAIYAKESYFLFIGMYSLLSLILCFWITLFSVFSYAYAKETQSILEIYSTCISKIKSEKYVFLYISVLVFLISISPVMLTEDYRIVLGIITAHVFLKYTDIVQTIKSGF